MFYLVSGRASDKIRILSVDTMSELEHKTRPTFKPNNVLHKSVKDKRGKKCIRCLQTDYNEHNTHIYVLSFVSYLRSLALELQLSIHLN